MRRGAGGGGGGGLGDHRQHFRGGDALRLLAQGAAPPGTLRPGRAAPRVGDAEQPPAARVRAFRPPQRRLHLPGLGPAGRRRRRWRRRRPDGPWQGNGGGDGAAAAAALLWARRACASFLGPGGVHAGGEAGRAWGEKALLGAQGTAAPLLPLLARAAELWSERSRRGALWGVGQRFPRVLPPQPGWLAALGAPRPEAASSGSLLLARQALLGRRSTCVPLWPRPVQMESRQERRKKTLDLMKAFPRRPWGFTPCIGSRVGHV